MTSSYMYSFTLNTIGVLSRTMGIMPEKAFKMQAWIIVGQFMERHFADSPMAKWIVGGAGAGGVTALIGQVLGEADTGGIT